MNPTFFGKRMRNTNGGYRYVNKAVKLHVSVLRMFTDHQWRYALNFGSDCWMQSSDVFGSAEDAVVDIEKRLRRLRVRIAVLSARRAR